MFDIKTGTTFQTPVVCFTEAGYNIYMTNYYLVPNNVVIQQLISLTGALL